MRSSEPTIKQRRIALIEAVLRLLLNMLESPILIVEDDETIMEGLKRILEGEGTTDSRNIPHEGV